MDGAAKRSSTVYLLRHRTCQLDKQTRLTVSPDAATVGHAQLRRAAASEEAEYIQIAQASSKEVGKQAPDQYGTDQEAHERTDDNFHGRKS